MNEVLVCWCDRAGGSVDTEMDRLHLHVDTPCAKSATNKKSSSVFGSLERGMDRLLCMLTPKKKQRSTPSASEEPRTVKVSLSPPPLLCVSVCLLIVGLYSMHNITAIHGVEVDK